MKKSMMGLALIGTLAVAGSANAGECSCEARGGDTVLSLASEAGKALLLRFPTAGITTATGEAQLCSDVDATVTLAKLWMPEHGHGSRPTILTAASPRCTLVERVRFSMTGGWEIQVSFDDADKAVFAFDVARAP